MTTLALAPLNLSSPLVALVFGIAFGFVLERSGFGDSRRLAAQFYFSETRVLKVMFTAIVVCLLLLTAASSLGVLDFGALALNPTYLWTALIGGLLLGVGFIIGGYCPGTSIVSAATGKVDGMFFLGGVFAGVFAFGETGGLFRVFYDNAGAMGVATLPEVLGLPFGLTVALVVAMAAGMFWAATLLERKYGEPPAAGVPAPSRPRRRGALLLRVGAVGALAVLLVAFARPAAGGGAADERIRLRRAEYDATLASRAAHADPVEVAGLLQQEIGGKPARFHLELLDLRPEPDWNLFHLQDAKRASLDSLRGEQGRDLARPVHATSIVVVMSNDEAAAEEAWRVLRAQGVAHAYVLSGGVNLWLDVFRDGRADAAPASGAAANDRLRHAFPSAMGDRYAFARPPAPLYRSLLASRKFESHVRPVAKAPKATGGCG